MKLPNEKKQVLDSIIAELKKTENVVALVLGGSYATGTATPSSDLDIGIYYSDSKPFLIEDIRAIANQFSINSDPVVTGFYEWGPWVNGGAWIDTAYGKVDFLYKNIEQIEATIDKAINGEWQTHFEQQPPYGFSSIIFLAETKVCIPLHDPCGIIEKLKERVRTYPVKLKQSVVQQSLWSAEFSIWQAESFAKSNDMYNTMGCLTRALKNIVDCLFALNELYPLGDKRAIGILNSAPIIPAKFEASVNKLLSVENKTLPNNVAQLKELFRKTVELTNGSYRPYYDLGKPK